MVAVMPVLAVLVALLLGIASAILILAATNRGTVLGYRLMVVSTMMVVASSIYFGLPR